MTTHVHLLRPPDEEHLQHLRTLLDSGIVLTIGEEIVSPEVINVLVAGRPERRQLEECRNLDRLIIPFAGIPESTLHLLKDFPEIRVHNLHFNASATAEMAIALMLAASKWIVPIDKAFRDGDWRPRYKPNPSLLLEGKTALVLGYGAIGRRVAQICQSFGMKVIAVRRQFTDAGQTHNGVSIHAVRDLQILLPEANVVLVCLPLTDDTRGLIGEYEIGLLPKDTILVNVARGPVVDEEAMFNALRNGDLYAAGIDVWYRYPEDENSRSNTYPSRFPFHELENVVMSPHRAGGSIERELKRMVSLADLLNFVARGDPVPDLVKIKRGY
jgi:phosphoglycerate dehydrogenase-like enzyme